MMNGMEGKVLLYETSSLPEAEILRGWFESNGIQAILHHDDCGGVSPGLTFSRGIRIFVGKKDESRARILLKEFLEGTWEEDSDESDY